MFGSSGTIGLKTLKAILYLTSLKNMECIQYVTINQDLKFLRKKWKQILLSTGNILNKMSNTKLFESKKIRSHWDDEQEKWYFSIIDMVEILTDSPRPRKYWNALKTKMQAEGSEVSRKIGTVENGSF